MNMVNKKEVRTVRSRKFYCEKKKKKDSEKAKSYPKYKFYTWRKK